MLCVNYWTSCYQVGSHHIARAFAAAGWEVAFLSSPITPLNLARPSNPELKDRLAIYKPGGIRDCDERLWAYIPFAILTPDMLPRTWVQTLWPRLSYPNVYRQLDKQGFTNVDLVYIDNVRMVGLLDRINYKKSIFRMTDDNTAFPGHNAAIHAIERTLVQSVDLVLYSAQTLRPRVEAMRPKQSLHVPNGVHFDQFASRNKDKPQEYTYMSSPIAVYVGAMEFWFDFDLLEETARRLPDVSFVLIGPTHLAKRHLGHLSNVYLLGPKKHKDLPPYLHHAQAGLLPFNVSGYPSLINATNPLKLYEYFASGLPVVSTEWEELIRLESPAIRCQSPDRFIEAITQAISSQPDRQTLMDYARTKDWNQITSNLFDWFDRNNFLA